LNRIGIKFETGEMNPEQMKGDMHAGGGFDRGEGIGEGNPEDGGGPGGGRFRGGGNPGGRFGAMGKVKRMDLWLSVQLASQISQ